MNKTDTSTQLQEIKTETLERIRFALEASFREELNTTGFFAENTTWSIPAFGYENGDEPELLKYVETITETNDVRLAYAKVYEELEARKIKSSKEAQRPEEQQKTTINKDESAQLQEEAERRGEQIKQAEENAKKEVERAIENLEVLKQRKDQELKDLEVRGEKDKKYYAKVEATKIELTAQEQEVFTELKEIAKDNPQAAKEILIEIIEKNSGQSLRDLSLSKDEIKTVIEGTAAQVTENLHNFDNPNFVPQTHQTAILTDVAHKPEQYGKSISDSANNVATTHLLQYQIYKDVTTSTLGVNFANTVFGQSPDQVQISISDTPQAGYTQTFTPYSFVQSDRQTAADQSETLALVKDFGTDRGKQVLLGQAGKLIEKRMSLLAPQSTARRLLGTAEVKSLLFSRFGIGTPIQWTATNVVGKIALNFTPEYVPLISGVGKITGLNFGLVGKAVPTGIEAASQVGGQVAGKAAGQIAGKATGQAVGQATAKVATGLLPKIFAAIGALGSWFTFGLTAAAGWLLGKIAEKIDWKKVGEALKYYIGFKIGTRIIKNFTRKLRPAVIAGAIWSFFAWIGANIVITIARPIIITLLILPPLVAFIMLVINNSAYMVPGYPGEYSKPPEPGIIPGGGQVSHCTESAETGPEITNELVSRIPNGFVNILPDTVWGRRDGICIKPTMIIMHWSAGPNDDPNGNDLTYNVLVERNLSCQLGTDTNDVWLMEKFFEKQVEFPACAKQWNTYSINNEMAGVSFTKNPPPPNLNELELAYNATCEIMKQYGIPWSQIYGHYQVPYSGKVDPGEEFLQNVFIPEIRKRCPNEQ